ncbi:MAG: 50S ribosomal protein L17 [Candidatus Gracilibacteria bacterium]|jgi:large subunit ribosomal protein L17
MRHLKKQHKLSLRKKRRVGLLKNLAQSLVIYEQITTTEAKAKALREYIERLINNAKKAEKTTAIREANRYFSDKNAAKKLLEVLVKKYANKSSGFTRIVKTSPRVGDAAPMAIIELI